VAEIQELGLTGRFDADGARLALHRDTVGVRLVGFGRDTLEATGTTT
jgi:hypothetical protein